MSPVWASLSHLSQGPRLDPLAGSHWEMGGCDWGIPLPPGLQSSLESWMWGLRGLCRHRGCSRCFLQVSPAGCLVESLPRRTGSLRPPSLDIPGLPTQLAVQGAPVILGMLMVWQCWHVSVYRVLSFNLGSLKAGFTHR